MNAAQRRLCVLAALIPAACGGGNGGLAVADAYGYPPLARGTAAVAYLTIRNTSDDDIVVNEFTSPLFAQVELHETSVEDGVARMRPVDRLQVPARGSATLAPGGMHLMLREPDSEIAAGVRVPLRAILSDGGRLEFDVVLETRSVPGANR